MTRALRAGGLQGFTQAATINRAAVISMVAAFAHPGAPLRHALLLVTMAAVGIHAARANDLPASTGADASRLIAELTHTIDSRHATPGSTFRLSVMQPWSIPSCSLKQGSSLYGHVVAIDTPVHGARGAVVRLLVDAADCLGAGRTSLPLTITALASPDDGAPHNLHSVLPREIGGHGGMGGLAASVGDDEAMTPAPDYTQLHPGSVRGIPNLRFSPTAGGAGTVLFSRHGSLRIEAHVIFVLAASPVTVRLVPGDGGGR